MATRRMLATFGSDVTMIMLNWSWRWTLDDQIEQGLLTSLAVLRLRTGIMESKVLLCVKEKRLANHQASRFPEYSMTGDNVDFRIMSRFMSRSNQAKDVHLFNIVAYKLHFPMYHLPNSTPLGNIGEITLERLLPSAEEQLEIFRNFAVLDGHVWATYIPRLKFLPEYVEHKRMEQIKQKTEQI